MAEFTDIDLAELGIEGTPSVGDAFGGETQDVNALRARTLWMRGSVRLLADLIHVTRDAKAGLEGDGELTLRAQLASPSLLRGIDPDPRAPRSQSLARARKRKVHRLWVMQKDGLGAPLEALTHMLAYGIARQFREPAVVVTFARSGPRVHRYTPATEDAGVPECSAEEALSSIEALEREAQSFLHELFVAPAGVTPKEALGELYGQLHRIVHLTDRLPDTVPAELIRMLYPAVRRRIEGFERLESGKHRIVWSDTDEGPFFSSFVASLVRNGRGERREVFQTTPVDLEFDDPDGAGARGRWWRIERDHCRVFFDLDTIATAWRKAPIGAKLVPTFLAGVLEGRQRGGRTSQTTDRWARAVTNRSVGIALSGGGASSYALVPLLRRLEGRVPIDVLSGVSGGAFLGAYYCKDGSSGLDRCIEDGWLYQLGLLPNAVIAKVGQWITDWTHGGVCMGDTERRFVPITIKLATGEAPCAHRVVSGTLGDAVQVSGAAPVLFAPVVKRDHESWSRYADGGLAMMIPARILRDCGADIIFACNSVAGPATANPLAAVPGLGWLYDLTPAGGLVDLWMTGAYMQQRLGRATALDVSAFFEAPVEPAPAWKSVFFYAARKIVREAEGRTDLLEATVNEFEEKWRRFALHAARSQPPAAAAARRNR